jgi:hypothetical protein
MTTWYRSRLALALRLVCALAAVACEHEAPLGFACPAASLTCLSSPAADSGAGPLPAQSVADGGDADRGQTTEPLSVSILNSVGETITKAQLACGTACLEVVARVTGGEPPYTYEWDDASTTPERTLCPDASAHHTLHVSDNKRTARVTAELDLDRASCPPDAGAPPVTPPVLASCRRFSVGEYMACGNVGTRGDMPRLDAMQPYTLQIHSNLSTAGDMQVTAVGEGCGYSEQLESFSLPTGVADQTLCLTPTRDTVTLMITVTSGGSAAFLTNVDSYVELCGGCD